MNSSFINKYPEDEDHEWLGEKKYEKSIDQKSEGLYYRPVNVRQKSRSMPPIDPARGNPAFFNIVSERKSRSGKIRITKSETNSNIK